MFENALRWITAALFAGLFALLIWGTGLEADETESARQEVTVLDTNSFWRCHFTLRMPVVRTDEGLKEVPPQSKSQVVKCATPLPPEDWNQVGFDDSAWCRVSGSFSARSNSTALSLLCLRGKFTVRDPDKVEGLTLSLSYRGGVVVYINGKELVRGHMPGGNVDMETLAEDYPLEANATPEGEALPTSSKVYPERIALRTRSLTNIAIPSLMLTKGLNVLAVELHRVAHHQLVVEEHSGKLRFKRKYDWATVGLTALSLKAPSGASVVPNVDRPGGFQVWNASPLAGVFDLDYADPHEKVHAIELVGTRNGFFSGQVIVGSDKPIKKLEAKVYDLKLVGGKSRIPTSSIQLRYALPGTATSNSSVLYYGFRDAARFDGLTQASPKEVPVRTKEPPRHATFIPTFGAVEPIWVTVKVPRDAQAGNYEGVLAIRAQDLKQVDVPLRLEVLDWTLPDPQDFTTFVDLVQSPTTLALKYNVPLWSDAHFKLIDRSFTHMATLGSKAVYITMICQAHFGNSESMVRWIRQPDGTYTYDFTIFDRYLDLAIKHMGKPKVVCLYLWDRYTGGAHYFSTRARDKDLPHWQTVLVSLLDPATGKVELLEGPSYEKQEESEAFWRPVLTQVCERLAERGLLEAMMFGIGGDVRPGAEVVALLDRVLPGTKWVMHQHGEGPTLHSARVGYLATVWRASRPVDPDIRRKYGWNVPYRKVQFPRELGISRPLKSHRLVAEWNLTGGQPGFGRIGADFWPVIKDKRGRMRRVSGRYLLSGWAQLSVGTYWLAPGLHGPLTTVRMEMAREGIQECEARIFLEKVLTDETLRARLGKELAVRCQETLDERTRYILYSGLSSTVSPLWYPYSGWQQRSAKLYRVAAEAAEAMK